MLSIFDSQCCKFPHYFSTTLLFHISKAVVTSFCCSREQKSKAYLRAILLRENRWFLEISREKANKIPLVNLISFGRSDKQ